MPPRVKVIQRILPLVDLKKAVKPSVIFQEYQRDKLRKMIEIAIVKFFFRVNFEFLSNP